VTNADAREWPAGAGLWPGPRDASTFGNARHAVIGVGGRCAIGPGVSTRCNTHGVAEDGGGPNEETWARMASAQRRMAEAVAADPAVSALFDEARKRGRQPSRQLHLVPKAYLRRWASRDVVGVTDIDHARSWTTSYRRAARERDYYSLASPDLDPGLTPPLLMEVLLSFVESEGLEALTRIVAVGIDEASDEDRRSLAALMAFQYLRGERARETLKAITQHYYQLTRGDLTENDLRELLSSAGSEPSDDEVNRAVEDTFALKRGDLRAEPQRAALVGEAFVHAEKIATHFLGRVWHIVETPRSLLTTDEPVTAIGGPGSPRDEAVGLDGAAVVVFPIDPGRVLTMFDPLRTPSVVRALTVAETDELNRELLANASRWAFDQPHRITARRLAVPRAPMAATLREEVEVSGPSAAGLVRIFRRTRWSGVGRPPGWPVKHWYR